jgi:hypothetical protein
LPVTDGDTICGVVTTLSIIAFESVTPGVPVERDPSDVWESEVPDEDDVPAAEYFAELWEDAGTELDERFRVTDSPEWDFLSEHRVEEAMISDPIEFPPRRPSMRPRGGCERPARMPSRGRAGQAVRNRHDDGHHARLRPAAPDRNRVRRPTEVRYVR